MEDRFTFKGRIKEQSFGENPAALFVDGMDEPLARKFYEAADGCQVSVRYWISDKEKTKRELQENQMMVLVGAVDAEYRDRYSDITGYLWTDEELNIGGHDLGAELQSHLGKFVYLEMDVQLP